MYKGEEIMQKLTISDYLKLFRREECFFKQEKTIMIISIKAEYKY